MLTLLVTKNFQKHRAAAPVPRVVLCVQGVRRERATGGLAACAAVPGANRAVAGAVRALGFGEAVNDAGCCLAGVVSSSPYWPLFLLFSAFIFKN